MRKYTKQTLNQIKTAEKGLDLERWVYFFRCSAIKCLYLCTNLAFSVFSFFCIQQLLLLSLFVIIDPSWKLNLLTF